MSQIVVPQLGESVVEARVARWLKNVGDAVAAGEPLVELETDKIDLEVGADQAGVLSRIDRQAGEDVKVGELLAVVVPGAGASATAPPAAPDAPAQPRSPASPAAVTESPAAVPGVSVQSQAAEEQRAAGAAAGPEVKATATARRMAEDHAVNLSQVPGSGDGGRVTKEDVQKYLAGAGSAQGPAGQAPGSGLQAPGAAQTPPGGARAQGATQAPAAASQPPAEARPPAPSPRPPAGSARARRQGERTDERIRMSKRRATIAKRLVEAQHTAAMLTTFNEVDMSAVMALRARRTEAFL